MCITGCDTAVLRISVKAFCHVLFQDQLYAACGAVATASCCQFHCIAQNFAIQKGYVVSRKTAEDGICIFVILNLFFAVTRSELYGRENKSIHLHRPPASSTHDSSAFKEIDSLLTELKVE
jgi:hypothetical protein